MLEIKSHIAAKALDLLIEEDSPEAIIELLRSNEDDLLDIFNDSINFERIFQLDFFLKLSEESQEYLFGLTSLRQFAWWQSDMKVLALELILCWQILRTNSERVQTFKLKHKRDVQDLVKNLRVRHPYAGSGTEGEIRQFDDALIEACIDDNFADVIANWSLETFKKFLFCLKRSIFFGRVLQLDVFSRLDDLKKYLLLEELKGTYIIEDLAIRVMQSQERIEVKRDVLRRYQEMMNPRNPLDPLEKFYSEKSFPKVYLQMSIEGIQDFKSIIVEKLKRKDYKFLFQWIQRDREEFQDAYDAVELVEELVREKSQKRKMKKS